MSLLNWLKYPSKERIGQKESEQTDRNAQRLLRATVATTKTNKFTAPLLSNYYYNSNNNNNNTFDQLISLKNSLFDILEYLAFNLFKTLFQKSTNNNNICAMSSAASSSMHPLVTQPLVDTKKFYCP